MDSIFHRKQGSNIFNYPVASIETKNHLNEPTEEDVELINNRRKCQLNIYTSY